MFKSFISSTTLNSSHEEGFYHISLSYFQQPRKKKKHLVTKSKHHLGCRFEASYEIKREMKARQIR